MATLKGIVRQLKKERDRVERQLSGLNAAILDLHRGVLRNQNDTQTRQIIREGKGKHRCCTACEVGQDQSEESSVNNTSIGFMKSLFNLALLLLLILGFISMDFLGVYPFKVSREVAVVSALMLWFLRVWPETVFLAELSSWLMGIPCMFTSTVCAVYETCVKEGYDSGV